MSQAFKVDLFSCSIISGLPDFKDSSIQLYTYNIHGYFMIFIFTKVTSNLQITSLMKCNVKVTSNLQIISLMKCNVKVTSNLQITSLMKCNVKVTSNLQITSLMKCNVKKYNFNDIHRIIMYTSMVIVNP